MNESWTLKRGASVLADGSTRFRVWAPKLQEAQVIVLRPNDRSSARALAPAGANVLEAVVPDVAAGTDYYYRISGSRDRPDPVSRHQPAGVHGPSRVVDPSSFEWTDAGWTGVEMADLIIFELHVGTFSEAGTFDGTADRLPYLSQLGVTAIELMPVAQFPGRRNWGYDGVHPYAPQDSYGGPEGLRRLVDAAHAAGLAVILDVVYNHLGPEGNYLSEFGPYFTDRYHTPWGLAINFDGPGSDEVRRYFIDNALYWITEFHIDGLRLDAVHAIFDFSALHILEELAAAVRDQAEKLGRRVLVIAESDLNDPRLLRSRERGGYALDAAWSDDFHHAVHAALSGERNGYYVDFGNPEQVAKAYRDRYVLDGRYSRFRSRRHGAAAKDVPEDRFVVFIQNHDQVGNRAHGDRLPAIIDFEAQKLAAALLLLSPYVPLLFMGEEYGETNPFLYFVDHSDPGLLEAVRRGRSREFERFDWSVEIPDPGSAETFSRSRLAPAKAQLARHAALLQLYKDLLDLRRRQLALRPGAATRRVQYYRDSSCITYIATAADSELLAGFNLGSKLAPVEILMPAGRWQRQFASDDSIYGGRGATASPLVLSDGEQPVRLDLAGHAAALYQLEIA